MSGEVKFVNAVEAGAEPSASLKISFGDTVRVDPWAEGSLTDVNAETDISQGDISPAKAWVFWLIPDPMFESNELLLFRSAMSGTWSCCERLLLELENNGTGGRWCCN